MKRVVALGAAAALLGSAHASAQTALPPAARAAGIEERIGERVPSHLRFTDTDGGAVELGRFLDGRRPVLVSLFYYRCPTLCGALINGTVSGLRGLSLHLGEDYRALTVSFDPRDGPEHARRKQDSVLDAVARPGARDAWPFLTGEADQSRALADALGFEFAYDEPSGEYAHPAALFVLTPDGRISRYLYGIDFSPRDLRLALVEAGEGKTGGVVDRVLLTCYRYDPALRRYGPHILGFMRLGALAIFAALATLLGALWRADRRRSRQREGRP